MRGPAPADAVEGGEHTALERGALRIIIVPDPPARSNGMSMPWRARGVERFGVAGVGVAHDAEPGIAGQHALQLLVRFARAVGDDDHAGMQRVADADAAAVVDRHPGRAGRRVEQRVQHRPVGDGVAAVAHAFGLAVRRGDRAGVEMIAADDDRRLDDAAPDQIVDRQAEARALAVAEPEDARRQSLERDALARQPDPAAERLRRRRTSRAPASSVACDVGRIAGQRRPAERALALAEQRADVLGHEAGNVERVGDAGLARACARMLLP